MTSLSSGIGTTTHTVPEAKSTGSTPKADWYQSLQMGAWKLVKAAQMAFRKWFLKASRFSRKTEMIAMNQLTSTQDAALKLLEKAGSPLDYRADLFGFATPDADRSDRIQMATAKALVARGLAVATRTRKLRGKDVIDQLALNSSAV